MKPLNHHVSSNFSTYLLCISFQRGVPMLHLQHYFICALASWPSLFHNVLYFASYVICYAHYYFIQFLTESFDHYTTAAKYEYRVYVQQDKVAIGCHFVWILSSSLALSTVSVLLVIYTLLTQSVVLVWALPPSLLKMQHPRPCHRPTEFQSASWAGPQVMHSHRKAWTELFCITAVACYPATLHPPFSFTPLFLKHSSSDVIVLLPWQDIRIPLFNKNTDCQAFLMDLWWGLEIYYCWQASKEILMIGRVWETLVPWCKISLVSMALCPWPVFPSCSAWDPGLTNASSISTPQNLC